MTRIPGRPKYCPRGYVLAALKGRRVLAARRFRPRWMTGTGGLCGSELRWLAVGRFIAVDVLLTPSIGEEAHVYGLRGSRFRLVRIFHADRIREARSGDFVLTWLTAARSPNGTTARQVWRWRNGRYRLTK